MALRIIMVGFGNVGRRVASLLLEKREYYQQNYNLDSKVIAVADSKGVVVDEKGLDLRKLLEVKEKNGTVSRYEEYGRPDVSPIGLIKEVDADVLLETTSTNVKDGEPGLSHLRTAIKCGMNVITSNKGPLVIDPDLDQAAGKNGVLFKYGATVTTMPVIDLSKYGLAGYDIASFEGIFTGVTNYILTEIEKGNSFEKALEVASKAGLVEKDPSIDLDGWDSACKVVILANSIMKKRATIKDISVRGIRDVDRNDILEAKRKNCTIKLIGEAARTNHSLDLKVQAKLIPQEHFFAKAKGLGKAISYKTDMEGEIILYSERYNLTSTAARIITDLLNLSNEIT